MPTHFAHCVVVPGYSTIPKAPPKVSINQQVALRKPKAARQQPAGCLPRANSLTRHGLTNRSVGLPGRTPLGVTCHLTAAAKQRPITSPLSPLERLEVRPVGSA